MGSWDDPETLREQLAAAANLYDEIPAKGRSGDTSGESPARSPVSQYDERRLGAESRRSPLIFDYLSIPVIVGRAWEAAE